MKRPKFISIPALIDPLFGLAGGSACFLDSGRHAFREDVHRPARDAA
jgi:hypothetical protein